MSVVIVDTGTANLASVFAALRRAGVDTSASDDPALIERADKLVLPGVGAFAAGMARLRSLALCEPLRRRVRDGRPLLGVCLGLQLLCSQSEESPGVCGLDVVPARVERFDHSLTVPQLGWNRVKPRASCALLREGYAYYANSYCIVDEPQGWSVALSVHGAPFVAALERGPQLLCQFHPELSGVWGQQLLRRWLRGGAAC